MAKAKSKTTKSKSKGNSLSLAVSMLEKAKQTVVATPLVPTTQYPHISTRSIGLDRIIGGPIHPAVGLSLCPGYPRSRITNIYGDPSTGKTTLALMACAEICSQGGTACYIDWEKEISDSWAFSLGCPDDSSQFLIIRPPSLEAGIKVLLAMCDAQVDLVVLDSVGAATPEKIMQQTLEQVGETERLGAVAAIWSKELPRIKTFIDRSNTAVIGISQLRATMNSFGKQSAPQGGNAWGYYSALKIYLKYLNALKGKVRDPITRKLEDGPVGARIRAHIDKCKVSDQMNRNIEMNLVYGMGIDNMPTILDVGVARGFIIKSGKTYTYKTSSGEEVSVAGRDRMIRKLHELSEAEKTFLIQITKEFLYEPLNEPRFLGGYYSSVPEEEEEVIEEFEEELTE